MSKSLTSVKVDTELYNQFKTLSSSKKFYLQDLVNKSLHLFVNEPSFRDQIYNHHISQLSHESQSVIPSFVSEQK